MGIRWRSLRYRLKLWITLFSDPRESTDCIIRGKTWSRLASAAGAIRAGTSAGVTRSMAVEIYGVHAHYIAPPSASREPARAPEMSAFLCFIKISSFKLMRNPASNPTLSLQQKPR